MTGPIAAVDAESVIWDVVVVGAGAGGATAGYGLARRGRSVLFLERGKRLHQDADVSRGIAFDGRGGPEAALRHGWWPTPFFRMYGTARVPAREPIGCGTGGSTAVFGMVMDRLRPEDFTPRRYFRGAPESSVPEAWPITLDDLAPFYQEAERLYRVRGTADPLGPPVPALLEPPSASAKELAVTKALEACGLHPYRIHYAQDRVPGCQGCAASVCPRECRNDADRICLRPAIERHGAHLLSECRVVRLEEEQRAVRRAICEWQGRRIAVRGRVFLVAANAFQSPALLLRSASDRFPAGLANSSGLVGRNLMLHASDFLLVHMKSGSRGVPPEMHHGLSLNDFYVHDGTKLGNVHVHPIPIVADAALSFIRMHVKPLNRLPAPLLRAGATVGARLTRSAMVFSTVVEDLPYPCNHVRPRTDSPDAVDYEYRHAHELRTRNWTMLQRFREAVSSRFTVRPVRPPGMLNVAHVCGTCRFGDDPATSVLDRHNRAHDVDNLYVVDASFFPSSGGINPSLTIAANSLRVSAIIDRRL